MKKSVYVSINYNVSKNNIPLIYRADDFPGVDKESYKAIEKYMKKTLFSIFDATAFIKKVSEDGGVSNCIMVRNNGNGVFGYRFYDEASGHFYVDEQICGEKQILEIMRNVVDICLL